MWTEKRKVAVRKDPLRHYQTQTCPSCQPLSSACRRAWPMQKDIVDPRQDWRVLTCTYYGYSWHSHTSLQIDDLAHTKNKWTLNGRKWGLTVTQMVHCLEIHYKEDCLQLLQVTRVNKNYGHCTLSICEEGHIHPTQTIVPALDVERNCHQYGAEQAVGYVRTYHSQIQRISTFSETSGSFVTDKTYSHKSGK